MTDGTLPPDLIEKLRQSGIRLDREGRFWHDDEEVSHERFRKTLLRWLDVLPDGRAILRLDTERFVYLDVDDAMLLVMSLRWQDDRAFLKLNDDSEEELNYTTLRQGPDNALYCLVRDGRLKARIATQAYYRLANAIEEVDDHYVLRAAGKTYAIRSHE